LPLSGLRVVDLTRILAGPFCSMLLADIGAEVIKIETPGEGDPVRRQGVVRDGLSWYFAGFNRNKRSVTLNLRHAEGRAVLEKLIAGSDVLVENFRPGVLAAMGFDEARLAALNPALVYCNITGFGSSGPYRDRPSFDFVAQAMSGFMSVTGEPEGAPMRAGPPIADLPDKPSLTVLPLQNLSGDPKQKYFVNAVVEEIIAAISRLPWRFVIVQFELWQRAQRRESSAS
jgi:crotonobetainyl-CoA:carnitine CoA-transferase CaiB-like acyl-CoA transferase